MHHCSSDSSSSSRDKIFADRENDWRVGPLVYQVFVDRFVPPTNPSERAAHFTSPRKFKRWQEKPRKGRYLPEPDAWSHELEFWGGDLAGVQSRLDYMQSLGIEVLYLNPVVESFTNHRYDTGDYLKVDPAIGNRADLARLAEALHTRGMKLILDGVFNHAGRRGRMFQDATTRTSSPWRKYFRWRDTSQTECQGWMDVDNLPELAWEKSETRQFLWSGSESVLGDWLKLGADGWRLDVAYEFGPEILAEITAAAHQIKPDSLIIGEMFNYPGDWQNSQDGLLNMHLRRLLIGLLEGKLSGGRATEMIETLACDAGEEFLLRSWLVLDNHDTLRLATQLPARWQQKMARVLQCTLPGGVCLYYGGETGMSGGRDPENRGPMEWEKTTLANPVYKFHQHLFNLRRSLPALRIGDYRRLATDRLFAFLRRTDRVDETVIIAANPCNEPVTEFFAVRDGRLQDVTPLRDRLSRKSVTLHAGTLELTVPAQTTMVLVPDLTPSPGGYSRYKWLDF